MLSFHGAFYLAFCFLAVVLFCFYYIAFFFFSECHLFLERFVNCLERLVSKMGTAYAISVTNK